MGRAPDLSVQVRDALPVELPSLEAVDAKLADLEQRAQHCRNAIESIRGDLKAIAVQRKAWQRVRDALSSQTRPFGANQPRVLEVLGGGQKMRGIDIARQIGISQSSAHSALAALIKKGKVTKVTNGVFRLAIAEAPHLAPVPGAVRVNPTPPPRESAATSLAGMEPLHGAAPKARCPVCTAPKWVDAVGLKEGSYVFRCPDCHTTFRDARGHRDRP